MRRLIIPQPGTLLVHDKFTGNDGDLLHARVPDTVNLQGSQWIKANTYDMEILGNRLTYESGGSGIEFKDNDHYIDVGCSAHTIECDLQIGDQSTAIFHSIVIRYIDNLNSTAVQWQTIGGTTQNLQIREQVGASGSSDIGVADGKTAPYVDQQILRIVDDGSSIVATLDGLTATATTSNNARSTKIALRTSQFDGQTWDNFKVWKT